MVRQTYRKNAAAVIVAVHVHDVTIRDVTSNALYISCQATKSVRAGGPLYLRGGPRNC